MSLLIRTLLVGWLGASLLACGGSQPGPKPASGNAPGLRFGTGVQLDEDGRATLDFGPVPTGERAQASIIVENANPSPFALTYVGPAEPFLLSSAPAFIIAGGKVRVELLFSPRAVGPFEAGLIIRSEQGTLEVSLRGEGRFDTSGCSLEASPAELRFTTSANEPSIPRVGIVQVRSVEGSCRIESAPVVGDSAFSSDSTLPLTLEEGQWRDLRVVFTPVAASSPTAELILAHTGGELRVPLGTKSENDCLLGATEDDVALAASCGPAKITLEDACQQPLTHLAGRWSNDRFSLHGEIPRRLAPGESAHLELDFLPSDPPWEQSDELLITAGNGDRLRVPLTGRLRWNEETFVLEPNETHDLLFVLDTAEGLAAYQHQIDRFLRHFVQEVIHGWDVDHRIFVTTTSMEEVEGCGGEAGRLIPLDGSRPQGVGWGTPDLEEVLRQNLSPPACNPSEGPKGQGLAAVAAALGDGAAPWRRGLLTVAIVTLEDDHSPEPISHYRELFDNDLGIDRLLVVAPTMNCPGSMPIPRYEAIAGPGGVAPICWDSTWAPTMGVSFGPTAELELQSKALELGSSQAMEWEDALQVRVKGEDLRGGFRVWGKILTLSSPGLRRGIRIDVRYPVDCRATPTAP